jgi:hypothetical protein
MFPLDEVATDVHGIPNFAFGFCHGTTNVPGDAYVDHFCGVKLWNSQSTALVMDGVTNDYRYNLLYFTTATSASGFVYHGHGFGPDDPDFITKSMVSTATSSLVGFMFDIQRGTGMTDYTCSRFTYENDPNILNPSDVTYYTAFATDLLTDPPVQPNYKYVSFSTASMVINEALSGSFDSICVWWDRTDPVMEIADIYLVRLA